MPSLLSAHSMVTCDVFLLKQRKWTKMVKYVCNVYAIFGGLLKYRYWLYFAWVAQDLGRKQLSPTQCYPEVLVILRIFTVCLHTHASKILDSNETVDLACDKHNSLSKEYSK